MKQILAILRKDARRSRTSLAIATGVAAALAVLTPRYEPFYTHAVPSLNRAIDLLQFLLPLVWWAAVAHLVHGEPLPGDRQFWLTRPYSRLRLLGSKLLFCAAFLLAPFLLADLAIVSGMGFSPVALFPQLVLRQFVLGGKVLIPAFLVAALTRSLRQFVLSLLGCAVAVTLIFPIIARRPDNYVLDRLAAQSHVPAWFGDHGFLLWCAVTLGFLAWLYGSRRVAIARAVTIGAVALILGSLALPSRAFVAAPAGPRHPEIAIAFAPQRHVTTRAYPEKIQIDLPVEVTGRGRDLLDWELGQITITPAEGPAWTAPWNYSVATARRTPEEAIEFYLDAPEYERLSRGPVRVDAITGVTIYDFVETVAVPHMNEWTTVPGVGKVQLCNAPETIIYFSWRTPLGYPAEKLVYRVSGVPPAPHSASYGHPTSQLFGISPVQSWGAPLIVPAVNASWPAEIDVERETDFVRRDLTIPNVRLSDWLVKP